MGDDIIKVLLIDDDEDDFIVVRDYFASIKGAKYDLEWCATFDAGLEVMIAGRHEVYLLDYQLGAHDGLQLLECAIARGCKKPIILLTGQGDYEIDVRAMKAGAADYLGKPQLSAELLDRSVRYSMEGKRNEAKLEEVLNSVSKSHDDLLSILNQLRLGTAITDESGQVMFLSDAGQRILGKRQEEVEGQHWADLFAGQDKAKTELENMLSRTPEQRGRVMAERETSKGRRYRMEIEITEDPRDTRRKIFLIYDVSEVHDLRRLLKKEAKFHDLVGKSRAMSLVYQQVRDVAAVDSTVLIVGDTGTGKELAARAVHYSGHRSAKPFVTVNCAGLTESLVASQLFGHKRGAFTGAVEDHRGLFEAAEGGTLFLDEIGDVPLNVQTSLLRVLQEREITRVGDTKPRKIDVRFIAASQHDLKREVEDGRFRSDLLYRIQVARIHLPPLSERREDIPLLAATFLSQSRATTGKTIEDISEDTLRVLMEYDWPGNVRELKSAVESSVIRCKSQVIEPKDLPPELFSESPPPAIRLSKGDEKQRLLEAVEQAGGNRSVAARLLGVSRATFYRRLASLGIEPER